jgi:hypothetical protein
MSRSLGRAESSRNVETRHDMNLSPRGMLLLLLASMCATFWVCTSTRVEHFPVDEFEYFFNRPILSVTMKDGSTVTFNRDAGRYSEEWTDGRVSRHVIGADVERRALDVDLSKALEVSVEYKSSDTGGTILTVLGTTLVGLVLFVVIYFTLNPIRS